ncbi:MAG: T9SS type A sorting domain-containing protein [candidate division WOR-3 bacterium]|nr:T9SS type A sorting domain-containing protein [candidate division WOR-3 bacterium]
MKKLIVIFFAFLIASAEWQKREEFTLPKGIQVNDIKAGSDGNIWILTKSSISKVELAKENLTLVLEVEGGRLFAIRDGDFIVIDNSNRISVRSPEGEIYTLPFTLTNPIQAEIIKAGTKKLLAVAEPNRIVFIDGNEMIGILSTNLRKFSIPPLADETSEIVIYTMNNNQIYAWTGKDFRVPSEFRNQLIYSAGENIIDFVTGIDGKSYILFKDSILVLKANGGREDKIISQMISPDSRLYTYPSDNAILLFDRTEKTLAILSRPRQTANNAISLGKNRPNPVEDYTEFEFTLNESMYITFTIYNLIGKPVKTLANGFYYKGTHTIPWHAEDDNGMPVPNGVYFYRLETKKGVLIKQLIVLR